VSAQEKDPSFSKYPKPFFEFNASFIDGALDDTSAAIQGPLFPKCADTPDW
jgi:hypothetical protein